MVVVDGSPNDLIGVFSICDITFDVLAKKVGKAVPSRLAVG